ncbi:hypothetical protein M758_8G103000 [Ceratodon purpureus]|uniref:Uncharacterized protein n=1 Tax=Ceratodon purpureus TaxID=3225 RepID=A0A8T0GX98_CERPU|nr:hypothetical protein KC19_8G106900 [Ceratodon purpureus]KAG0608397.1 hypothetical protein M758_8G103000 [Ceratodon purpureus]
MPMNMNIQISVWWRASVVESCLGLFIKVRGTGTKFIYVPRCSTTQSCMEAIKHIATVEVNSHSSSSAPC